jgi:ribosomal protein S18 acetylase RimI-like enzyme
VLALGVAPAARRQGLGRRLLEAHLAGLRPAEAPLEVTVTAAERDVFDPLSRETRAAIARSLFGAAGFSLGPAPGPVGAAEPAAILARRA